MFHSERPEKMGYPIAGVEQEGEGGAAAEQPIEVYLAKADPAKGQQIFNKCMACHNADKGGANQLGPNLWGVLGEPIGQGKGFAFSDALCEEGRHVELGQSQPVADQPARHSRPGTKMTFAGLGDPQDRANVIAFLNQHSDAPKPLPAAPAAANGSTGQQAAGNPPGNGPNNGPQKAGKEPVLTEQQTGADPKNAADQARRSSPARPASRPRSPDAAYSGGPRLDQRRRRDARRRNSARTPRLLRRPRSSG